MKIIYDPFFTRKTPISENNSLTTPLFYSVRTFTRIRQTTSQNIGGTDAWAVPTSNFRGTVPPVPI